MSTKQSDNRHSAFMPLLSAEDVRWVVNDSGELGVEINGQYFFCYKGESIQYDDDPKHDDGSPIMVRQIGKREFGETVWPMSWMSAGRREDTYAIEVEYNKGLSDGGPDDPRWKWKPLGGEGELMTWETKQMLPEDELRNRAGHDPTALVVDDTKYECDDCDGGLVKPCRCGQPARYFGEALMGSVSCTVCDEFVMGVDVPDIRERWNRGERGHVDG